MRSALRGLFVVAAVSTCAAVAHAHGSSPGALVLAEREPGTFDLAWTEPVETEGDASVVRVRYPAGCAATRTRLFCADGLDGDIVFEGLASRSSKVLVAIRWRDGRSFERLAGVDAPRVRVAARAKGLASAWAARALGQILAAPARSLFAIALVVAARASWTRRAGLLVVFAGAEAIALSVAAATGAQLAPSVATATLAAGAAILAAGTLASPRRTSSSAGFAALAGAVAALGSGGLGAEIRALGAPHGALAIAAFDASTAVLALGALALSAAAAALVGRSARRAAVPLAYAVGCAAAWCLLEA